MLGCTQRARHRAASAGSFSEAPLRPAYLLALGVSLAAWLSAKQAAAADFALQVQAGATCISEPSLRARVEHWLAAAPIGPCLTVQVVGSERDARVVRFELSERGKALAQRAFSPGPWACDQLEESLAVAIAFALKAAASPVAERPQAQPAPWEVALSGSALALLGLAPRVAYGGAVTLDVLPAFPVWMRVGIAGLSAADGRLGATGRFDLRALFVRAYGCAFPLVSAPVQLATCLGLQAGSLWAQGERSTIDTHARRAFLAASAAAALHVRVSSAWSVAFDAALLASLVRTRFEARALSGAVLASHALPVGSLELSVGPRLRF